MLYDHATLIDRNRRDICAIGPEKIRSCTAAGRFHCYRRTCADEQVSGDIQRLLNAGNDYDLIWAT